MPSRWARRREAFRSVLSGSACIHPASVHDPISARIAADLGFETGMLAGSVASLSVLGAPDMITLTMTELAEQVRRISRAAELPLMVDADHGYGNALNVMRTVEELEAAGAAGLSIEDTVLPRPFGPHGAPSLISIAEGIGKMRAAVEARSDRSLVIAARTGAVSATGVSDAIARIRAYAATGVDAIFLTGVRTREELEAVAGATSLPIILGGGDALRGDRQYLARHGIRMALQGHQAFQAAVQAVYETMRALRAGTAPADLKGLGGGDLMSSVMGQAEHERQIREYMGGEGCA